ncbi:hypothetical protein [Streptomyces sp. NPDC051546]|uniref:hypothetical protein n=1 Tax=Streptomyces sp. NPDC051546 TaxID=3365655 RepID=UPI00379DA647
MTEPRLLSDVLLYCVRAHPRKRIAFDVLADAAYAADPALLTAPDRRYRLANTLHILRDTGILRLPIARKHWDRSTLPPLPHWAERVDPPRPSNSRPPPRSWVAELSFLDGCTLSPADRHLFTRLNAFLLADGASREMMPLRDRAFELFDDEKSLDGIHDSKWVLGGLLSLQDHLRAYLTPAPLNIVELGPAPWLLIVENTAAFDNLRGILRHWSHPHEVGWIAFGDGDRIASSITTIPNRLAETGHPLEEILYYGDLDYDGLHCVTLTNQRSMAVGLPPLHPAGGLYAALLTRRPRQAADVLVDAARNVCAWLPSTLAASTAEGLAQGTVHRQEALSLPALRSVLIPGNGTLRQQLATAPAPPPVTGTEP